VVAAYVLVEALSIYTWLYVTCRQIHERLQRGAACRRCRLKTATRMKQMPQKILSICNRHHKCYAPTCRSRTPYEVVRGQKPLAAHLNVVGAQAHVLNNKLKHGEKLESHALIGQLVEYDSTNIYQVWMPALEQVLRTRDVVCMSNDGTEPVYPDWQTLREVVTILDVQKPPEVTRRSNCSCSHYRETGDV
jgi:hypothetical protein